MIGAKVAEARCATYELEIDIDASPDRVWDAIFDETNAWWLPDFHLVGASSKVTFDARPGGHLVEALEDGSGLVWYTVQWIRPAERTVYLIGHIGPEWGGPATSMMKLAVDESGAGAVLRITDAHTGHVDEKRLEGQKDGWKQLFTDGLKAFIEQGAGER